MNFEAIDYQSKSAPRLFTKSLRESGFGVLKNHPIEQQTVTSIYHNWQDFFHGNDKQSFLFNSDTQDGFFPCNLSEVAKGHTAKDIKEYFHYYPWGQCPASLRKELADYYAAATQLAAELLGWVEQYTPTQIAQYYTEPLSLMIEGSQQSLLRVLHYPPLRGDEEPNAIRAAAHEDINLLTILPASNEPGLQVKRKDGSWLDVPCDFGSLIVNTGDMLQEASGGYYPSTTHRVINPQARDQRKSRISLPLFLHPRPEVLLSERYTAKSYLNERLRELGVM